jgi:hypothetical protein
VVFGKLLAQVEADRVELGYIAHVPVMSLCRYLLFNEPPWVAVGFPCGACDDDLATQYTLLALAKSGGRTQFPASVPVQKQRLTTLECLPISFSRR